MELGVMLNNFPFKCRGHVIKSQSCEQFVPIENATRNQYLRRHSVLEFLLYDFLAKMLSATH